MSRGVPAALALAVLLMCLAPAVTADDGDGIADGGGAITGGTVGAGGGAPLSPPLAAAADAAQQPGPPVLVPQYRSHMLTRTVDRQFSGAPNATAGGGGGVGGVGDVHGRHARHPPDPHGGLHLIILLCVLGGTQVALCV